MLSTFSSKKHTRLGLEPLFDNAIYRIPDMCYLKGFHLDRIQGQVRWAK